MRCATITTTFKRSHKGNSVKLKWATIQFYFCVAVFVLLLKGLGVWLQRLFLLYTHTHQECHNPHKLPKKKKSLSKLKTSLLQLQNKERSGRYHQQDSTVYQCMRLFSFDLCNKRKGKTAYKVTNDLQIHHSIPESPLRHPVEKMGAHARFCGCWKVDRFYPCLVWCKAGRTSPQLRQSAELWWK